MSWILKIESGTKIVRSRGTGGFDGLFSQIARILSEWLYRWWPFKNKYGMMKKTVVINVVGTFLSRVDWGATPSVFKKVGFEKSRRISLSLSSTFLRLPGAHNRAYLTGKLPQPKTPELWGRTGILSGTSCFEIKFLAANQSYGSIRK